jgi:hypothetical protein
MIDKTLARMIDETLPAWRKLLRFGPAKMLEVRVNRAHLMCHPICIDAPSIA